MARITAGLPGPPPRLVRRERHVADADPRPGRRIERPGHRRGGGAARAGLAAALGAGRLLGPPLALLALGDAQRQLVGPRHRILHERSGHELAAAAIAAPLE